jgi:hypothetical protein
VLREAPVKAVDGMVLNGPALVKLAQAYIDAMNVGAMPTIHTGLYTLDAILTAALSFTFAASFHCLHFMNPRT